MVLLLLLLPPHLHVQVCQLDILLLLHLQLLLHIIEFTTGKLHLITKLLGEGALLVL